MLKQRVAVYESWIFLCSNDDRPLICFGAPFFSFLVKIWTIWIEVVKKKVMIYVDLVVKDWCQIPQWINTQERPF